MNLSRGYKSHLTFQGHLKVAYLKIVIFSTAHRRAKRMKIWAQWGMLYHMKSVMGLKITFDLSRPSQGHAYLNSVYLQSRSP